MSVSVAAAGPRGRPVGRTLLIAALALAAMAAIIFLIALAVSTIAPAPLPPRPIRHPFGMGAQASVPAVGGMFGWLIAMQSDFYRQLTGALRAMKESGAAAQTLMALSFAYGVFHAAGPGHGKAVIAGYIVASGRALRRGVGLSFAAAAIQAAVAIGIVAIFALMLRGTAAQMKQAELWVETASFAAVAAIGAWLLWRKAGRLAALTGAAASAAEQPSPKGRSAADPGSVAGAGAAAPTDGHWHLPAAEIVERASSWRELAGVALAAGIRPCSGAIIVLVFALAQGLFGAGVAAVLAMALGTALTTSALAIVAVAAKRAALAIASGRGRASLLFGATLETLAAAFVLLLGLGLMTGYWLAAGGS
jgi:ABC-type nickel/cobalt efflux system permease component RcnA